MTHIEIIEAYHKWFVRSFYVLLVVALLFTGYKIGYSYGYNYAFEVVKYNLESICSDSGSKQSSTEGQPGKYNRIES